MNDRRLFLKKSGVLAVGLFLTKITGAKKLNGLLNKNYNAEPPFKLPSLPYAYDALEPFIDAETMRIHHTKHHQSYVNKLNDTPSTNIDYLSSDEIKCTHVDQFTSSVIRNNLGGHYNHCVFWELLLPNKEKSINVPSGSLLKSIESEWNTFESFKSEFSEKAAKIFGSGWCWLIEKNGKLKITTTANQDNPLMNLDHETGKIILCLDVWEHAYYLRYQNRRSEYISNWWNIINWEKAQSHFDKK